MNKPPKQQQQVSKRSGSYFHVNIDSSSFVCLSDCRSIHSDRGNHFSTNAIMRRALRTYRKHLQSLRTEMAYSQELVEMERAAKGIL